MSLAGRTVIDGPLWSQPPPGNAARCTCRALHNNPKVGLVLVGFSRPQRLAALARHLRWSGLVVSDPTRALYRALGLTSGPGCGASTRSRPC